MPLGLLEQECEQASLPKARVLGAYNPLTATDNYEVGAVSEDERRERRRRIVMGHCPCPKISAPIYAAGFVVFSPL